MASIKSYLIRLYLHYTKIKNRHKKPSIQVQRKVLDAIGRKNPVAPDTKIVQASGAGIPITWILPKNTDQNTTLLSNEKVIFYVHGGGFRIGSVQSHKAMVSQLAHQTGKKVMMVTYRLSPEFPFPYGLDDVMCAYCWLLQQTNAQNIILAGDSAGGNLIIALVLKLLSPLTPKGGIEIAEINKNLPSKVLLFAPWVDLGMNSKTIRTFFDPLLRVSDLEQAVKDYTINQDIKNPYISPVYASKSQLEGFPPTLIQIGTLDRLLGENKILYQNMLSAGVPVKFSIWQNMIHVWQFIAHILPEGEKTWAEIKEFLADF